MPRPLSPMLRHRLTPSPPYNARARRGWLLRSRLLRTLLPVHVAVARQHEDCIYIFQPKSLGEPAIYRNCIGHRSIVPRSRIVLPPTLHRHRKRAQTATHPLVVGCSVMTDTRAGKSAKTMAGVSRFMLGTSPAGTPKLRKSCGFCMWKLRRLLRGIHVRRQEIDARTDHGSNALPTPKTVSAAC